MVENNCSKLGPRLALSNETVSCIHLDLQHWLGAQEETAHQNTKMVEFVASFVFQWVVEPVSVQKFAKVLFIVVGSPLEIIRQAPVTTGARQATVQGRVFLRTFPWNYHKSVPFVAFEKTKCSTRKFVAPQSGCHSRLFGRTTKEDAVKI